MHPVELVGQFGIFSEVPLQAGEPGMAQLIPSSTDAVAEVVVDPVGDEELRVLGPVVIALVSRSSSSPNGSPWAALVSCLLGAPQPMWLSTMISVGRSCSLRNTPKRGPAGPGRWRLHAGDVPAVSQEPGGDILGEG